MSNNTKKPDDELSQAFEEFEERIGREPAKRPPRGNQSTEKGGDPRRDSFPSLLFSDAPGAAYLRRQILWCLLRVGHAFLHGHDSKSQQTDINHPDIN